MRIGVNGRFLAAPPTGVQRFALEALRRLIPRADVTLFLPAGAEIPPDLPTPRVVVRGRRSGPLWEQLELPRGARRPAVDVVLGLANAGPVGGGPHVLVLHDLLPLSRPGDYRLTYRVWSRLAHVRAARRAAALATVSAWSRADIARRLGIDPGRIAVVPQGAAPLDRPAPDAAIEAVRARHGIDGRYFLAVPGGDPRKGSAFLAHLWQRRPAGAAAPTLVLVGRGRGRVHARGEVGGAWGSGGGARGPHRPIRPGGLEVASGGDPPGVIRAGAVTDEELRALYSGALALLHPSEAEGFGRPPLEALACGTRVVAAPYGPAREVLGDAADLVPLDEAAWQEALVRVMAEPVAERARRIAEGRERAASFTWEEGVARLLELCRRVAARKRSTVGGRAGS